jgi:two-component system C4-dicarboxylate transport sensor histidine kinase DctB
MPKRKAKVAKKLAKKKTPARKRAAPARVSPEIRKLRDEIARLKRQALVAERLRFDSQRKKRAASMLDPELLAAGIAHEFNNILGAADGHASWALESGTPEDMREALEVVRVACRRSAQITRALQGMVQPAEDKKEIFALAVLGNELGKILEPALRARGARLEVDLPDVLLYGRPAQVLEVLVNLAKNAIEAGSSSVKVCGKATASEIRMEVSDSGPGVPEAFRQSLFLPFFTSKGALAGALGSGAPAAQCGGTGLGLFLSRAIAEEHGGRLELRSSTGQGATFDFVLPRINK